MKKTVCFLLLLVFIFSGCQKTQTKGPEVDDAVRRIHDSLPTQTEFLAADADFVPDTFGNMDHLLDATVCFGKDDVTRQFGVFRLKDAGKAENLKHLIQKYLAYEKEALTTLAKLYPAEELKTRLSLYENAVIGSKGDLVYYFVLGDEANARAREAIENM